MPGVSTEPTASRPRFDRYENSAIARTSKWVLAAAAFLLPLAFLPNIVDEFVLPKLLLLRIVLVALVVLLILRWFSEGQISWRRTALDLPLLAFVGSAVLASIFAINRNVAIFGTYDRWEGLLTIGSYALLFWLAVQLLPGVPAARSVIWGLLASGYLVGVVAILQSGFGLLGGGDFLGPSGVIRADVTLANPDFLGIFLGMLLPVAFAKVIGRRPISSRMVAANVVVILLLGLLATFTRAAWISAAIGVIVVLALRQGRFHVWPLLISAVVIVGAVGVLAGTAATRPSASQPGFLRALADRVLSIGDVGSGTANERLVAWKDTLPLIANRPITGYGPDTFGLVYPQYQSVNWHGTLFDKPHQDMLGVLASQGIVGLVAYVWILVSFVRAFWQGRYRHGAVALFAGWVSYEIAIQADFSWVPASTPFWLFAAAAIVTWAPKVERVRVAAFPRRIAIPVLAGGSIVLGALLLPAAVFPYMADADYQAAQFAPDLAQARATIAQARQLTPYVVTYANEAGNYALNLDQNGSPSANADWNSAREAYEAAARLGSYSPEMFRELAIVDEHLGDHAAAVAAASRALELDRYDPASRKLLTLLRGE